MADTIHTYGEEPHERAQPGAEARPGPETRADVPAIMDDPVPLGLAAFGITALVVGTVIAGWWPNSRAGLALMAPVLLILGGIVQFIAGLYCYARRKSLAATFFGVFGGLSAIASSYVMAAPAAALLGPGSLLGPLAVGLAAFAFVALVLAVALSQVNVGFGITSLLLAVALVLCAISMFAQGLPVLTAIGGWVGLIAGACALVTAASLTMGRELRARVPRRGAVGAPHGRPQPT
jgi:uncharacterized protein